MEQYLPFYGYFHLMKYSKENSLQKNESLLNWDYQILSVLPVHYHYAYCVRPTGLNEKNSFDKT